MILEELRWLSDAAVSGIHIIYQFILSKLRMDHNNTVIGAIQMTHECKIQTKNIQYHLSIFLP